VTCPNQGAFPLQLFQDSLAGSPRLILVIIEGYLPGCLLGLEREVEYISKNESPHSLLWGVIRRIHFHNPNC